MGDLTVDIEIATTPLHEWMPSITYNPIDNEFLVLWHTTGVRPGIRMRASGIHRIPTHPVAYKYLDTSAD